MDVPDQIARHVTIRTTRYLDSKRISTAVIVIAETEKENEKEKRWNKEMVKYIKLRNKERVDRIK